jgi:LytS/YehU family sensor histidine kinase
MQLLKTRYGAGIDLRIGVDEAFLTRMIPPLTLQLLVENAVKHNMILPESPLVVEILIKDQQLVVQNNLQRKSTAVLSNKVGLANIATKYRLLSGGNIEIYEDSSRFAVTLPLLEWQNQTETNLTL